VRAFLAIALIACKTEETSSPPEVPPPSQQAGSSAPAPAVVHLTPKKVSNELAAMIPTVPAAKVLSTKAPNEAYALATWCIDETDAVARIKIALERDGWTNVHTRGEAPRIGIAAMKGDIRFSGRTGGSDTRCAGTYVTATVMRLGNIDAKLLEGADKIR
jgi:hypothetical protein